MKPKSFILTALLSAMGAWTYAAPPIEYRAVARDADGKAHADKQMRFRIAILASSDPTAEVYSETHNVLSDSTGHISLSIGEGIDATGDYDAIDWSTPRSLAIEGAVGNGAYRSYGSTTLLGAPITLQCAVASRLEATSPSGDVYELTVSDKGELSWQLKSQVLPDEPAYDLTKVPENLYLVGSFTGNGWEVAKAEKMQKVSDTRFTIDHSINPGDVFKFVGVRQWGDTDWSASSCEIGKPNPMREFGNVDTFAASSGTYRITVDFYTFTMTITKL